MSCIPKIPPVNFWTHQNSHKNSTGGIVWWILQLIKIHPKIPPVIFFGEFTLNSPKSSTGGIFCRIFGFYFVWCLFIFCPTFDRSFFFDIKQSQKKKMTKSHPGDFLMELLKIHQKIPRWILGIRDWQSLIRRDACNLTKHGHKKNIVCHKTL